MVLAVQRLDVLWPFFVLAGAEHVRIDPGNTAFTPLDFTDYPISHSLVGALVWASLFAAAWMLIRGQRSSAPLLFVGVASHWHHAHGMMIENPAIDVHAIAATLGGGGPNAAARYSVNSTAIRIQNGRRGLRPLA